MRRFALRVVWIIYITLGLSLLVISPAAAYMDPGTGSLIWSAVVGGLVGIPVLLAAFWGKITALFRRKR
jgi:hypothetical protein